MAAEAVEGLIREVSADSPTGPFIEYGDVAELERLAGAAKVNQSGGLLRAGDNQEWQAIADKAAALLARTKDLRVASILARALLYSRGVDGLADGLEVIQGLVSRYWSALYPPLEGGDASYRVNAISQLSGREEVIVPLRRIALVQSGRGSAFSLRDIELAGKPLEEGESAEGRPDPAEIALAFRDADPHVLDAIGAAIQRAQRAIEAVDAALQASASGVSSDLDQVSATLQQMGRALAANRASLPASGNGSAGGQGGAPPSGATAIEGIRTRQDVVRVLEQINGWYQAHEPSSPVPILLDRAKRLVFMSFAEAVKDLTPGGVSELNKIAGTEE